MRSNYAMMWVKIAWLSGISAMSWAEVIPNTYNVYLSSTNHTPQAVSFYNPTDQDVAVRARVYPSDERSADPAVQLSPQRFVVPAHASAAVEVEYSGLPRVVGDEYALEVVPLKAKTLAAGESTPPLTFLTTQKINLHILPETIRPQMAVHYHNEHAILQNTGNVSIWVQSLAACDSQAACHALPNGSRVRFGPGAWLDLGAIKPQVGFQVEKVWGVSAGKEARETIYLPTRI
jgi:hypothetical protein